MGENCIVWCKYQTNYEEIAINCLTCLYLIFQELSMVPLKFDRNEFEISLFSGVAKFRGGWEMPYFSKTAGGTRGNFFDF